MTYPRSAFPWLRPLSHRFGGRALVSGGMLIFGAACSGTPERTPYEIECNPPKGVELLDPAVLRFEADLTEEELQTVLHTDFSTWGEELQNDMQVEWASWGDSTLGAYHTGTELVDVETGVTTQDPFLKTQIEGEGRCESKWALRFESRGHNDWGSGFANWGLDAAPQDASEYDGLAIWARSATASDRAVLLSITDRYVSSSGRLPDSETGEDRCTCIPSIPDLKQPTPDANGNPRDPATPEEQLDLQVTEWDDLLRVCRTDADEAAFLEAVDAGQLELDAVGEVRELRICRADAKGEITCEDVPAPNLGEFKDAMVGICIQDAEGQIRCDSLLTPDPYECDNQFERDFSFTPQWKLYLLPFDSFFQNQYPNRRPEGMDASAIHRLTITVPRGAKLELWLDDITFYRRTDD